MWELRAETPAETGAETMEEHGLSVCSQINAWLGFSYSSEPPTQGIVLPTVG